MTDDSRRRLERLTHRGFGDIELRKHAAVQGQSTAMHEAATNLLDKAAVALEGGQADKARGYIARAERLPYDDYGGASPLSLAVHMHAFRSVLDVYELGDGVWVDAAELLLESAHTWKPLAVADFRHVLTVVRNDYQLTQAETRQLRALIAGHEVATIREMQDLLGEELCAVAIDLLRVIIEYERRVDELLAARETD